jgi:hypothetical protein
MKKTGGQKSHTTVPLSTMGYSAEYGSAMSATAQNVVRRCGPQRGICLESDTNQIPCIHMHVAVYPRVLGCISTCMWLCIHVHAAVYPRAVAVYQCAHGCVSTWSCIHMHVAVYPRQIWQCTMGHRAESGSALWATAQNFIERYGPQRRILLSAVGHCAEFH